MGLILLLLYAYCGAKANSFLKHHILHMRTAYVFNMVSFIFDKVFMSLALGWITIPLAILLWAFGLGRR